MVTSRTSPNAAGVNAEGGPATGPTRQEGAPVCRRILFIGFMGSGKSTVGRLLARRIEWSFMDVDRLIEEEAGRAIPQIFREDGEEVFRRIEHRITGQLLLEDDVVLVPGGGWPCRPGRIDGVPGGTLSIWLRVSPEAAFERVRGQRGGRPLLDVDDPLSRIRALIAEREPYYRRADWWMATDLHSPFKTVERVTERLNRTGSLGRHSGSRSPGRPDNRI